MRTEIVVRMGQSGGRGQLTETHAENHVVMAEKGKCGGNRLELNLKVNGGSDGRRKSTYSTKTDFLTGRINTVEVVIDSIERVDRV